MTDIFAEIEAEVERRRAEGEPTILLYDSLKLLSRYAHNAKFELDVPSDFIAVRNALSKAREALDEAEHQLGRIGAPA